MPEKCKFIKENGERCGFWPLKGELYCLNHSKSRRAYMLRGEAQYLAQQVRSGTALGRLIGLKNLAKEVNADRSLPLYRKSYMLIALFDEIDKLERKVEAEETAHIANP